jgi:hypothetical protein
MRFVVLLGLLLLSSSPPLHARELAGINIPDSVRLHPNDDPLSLNGAGIRRKLFVGIYVGALYLPQPARDLAGILRMAGAKRFSMHFIHAEIRPEKLVPVWKRGFEENLSPEEFRALRPRIANFNGLFPTLRKGDRVDIDMLPGVGAQVWINGKLRGKVAGDDFARALLHIWLGKRPADADLKRALLVGDGGQ